MALTPGAHLGPYEITSAIGAGGMGEVYRARDTTLGRQVAIKILPDTFAHDAERLARFEREARTLASLNHPNIAQIYGVERSSGVHALVLELVEGPTLADRIVQGGPEGQPLRQSGDAVGRKGVPSGPPIPIDEALAIARQIVDALEAAHEHGIVHRDLKPANIKVREDGTVKVLDFGLAKALNPTASLSPGATASPTITSPAMTQMGVILGTAAYMSPEQARGKPLDKRTDVWAFGCVLYETLTGQRAFEDEDVSMTLSKVLQREPDFDLLPSDLPARVRQTIRLCLRKPPRERIPDMGAVRLALEGAFETDGASARAAGADPAYVRPLWRRALPATLAAVGAALIAGVTAWNLRPAPESPAVNRFTFTLLDGQQFRNTGRPVMAFSPDGRHIVYNTGSGLYLRTLASLDARLIPGTEPSLTNPFFSPDGQSVGYFQAGQLKRIALSGGAPVVICAAQNPFGVSWERDNTILFGQVEGIMRVSANGGTPELVIKVEKGEQVHGPQLLPDGDTVLFSVASVASATRWDQAQIVAQSLRTGARKLLLSGGSDARYMPTGHLVYALGDGVFAIAFDVGQLQVRGGPVSLVEGTMRSANPQNTTASANYGVSEDGTLVYVARSGIVAEQRALVWVDRSGREEPLPAPRRAYGYPRLSPDGTRIALGLFDQENDIWTWDLARQTLTRLTFDAGFDIAPLWTADGRRLIFSSTRSGGNNLYWQAADGTGAVEPLTEGQGANYFPNASTPNGTEIVVRSLVQGSSEDLMRLTLPTSPAARAPAPTPLLQTMFSESNAEIAPGGQWLAYNSNESGQREIYVRPFPNIEGGRWQVSTAGGRTPLWSRDGRELFYMSPDGALMGVRVEGGPMWRNTAPVRILQGQYYQFDPGLRTYDIAPDGRRFLMIKSPTAEAAAPPPEIVIIQHWTEELKRRVPVE